jgi:aspartyl-tRNA synthetase
MAILCNASSIRDVIAFPKSAQGTDLLFRSPAAVGEEVLETYGLRSSRSEGRGESDGRCPPTTTTEE